MKRTPLVRKTPLKATSPAPRKDRAKKPTRGKSTGRSAPTTKKVDELWSVVVRERAGHSCQLHGCGNRLCGEHMDAHHIFGRGMSVRWNLDNGLCVCKGHHLWYIHNGNNQAAAQEDIREIVGPELYEWLRVEHHKEGKNSAPYRREVFDRLTALLSELRKAA